MCFALELNVLFVEIQSVAKLNWPQKLLRLLNNLKYKVSSKSASHLGYPIIGSSVIREVAV